MHEVGGWTRAALEMAVISGNEVRFTKRLPGSLWDAVAKVLNTLGGTYLTHRSAFAFGFDPGPAVRQVIETGVCRSVAEAEGYVPTPDVLAEELTTSPFSDLARMPAGSRVLDPSAGDGRIVAAILEANDEVEVVAVEPNTERAALIGDGGGRVTLVEATFEAYAAGQDHGKFDAVVMNPPFAVPGQPTLWIDHVMLAWNMLEPGARLVAVVPGGFADRSDRRHRDIRQLVEDFGGWQKLSQDTFANGFKTCVIWMARPVPGHEGHPPWLFRHYPQAIEPVPVKRPWLTTRAVREAPVQVWRDWSLQERVLRYRAQCWGCGWLLWEFDGENDMALGQHSARAGSLDASEYDLIGPSLGFCLVCANNGRLTADGAVDAALNAWRKPPTKAAAVSAWEALLTRGGMIPVDAVEHERHARVQAAMRVVFGVDEQAPEPELIDAREAKPWRGGPDRLAAKYLRAYADRLDPAADLDDADRAALLWRGDPDAPAIGLAEEPDPWGAVLDLLELELSAH